MATKTKATAPKILLRDPKIERSKETGRIVSITGRCTWRGCTKTRTIHASDAFQVRYCEEHRREAARAGARARRKRAKDAAKKG
jgi:hypothetical protein